MAKINLTRYQAEHVEATNNNIQVLPLKVIAEGIDMPSEIFVYQAFDNQDIFSEDLFRCVASVHDLYEFPKNNKVSVSDLYQIPYYRTNIAVFFCRSAQELERLWEQIKKDTKDLVNNFNADQRLKAVDQTDIEEDNITTETMKEFNQYSIELDARPAGDVDAMDITTFTATDDTLKGWLPVSSVPSSFGTVPAGALYYYNIKEATELKQLFPLEKPVDKHLLFYNGVKLTYNSMYVITEDTIYWMDFTAGFFDFFHAGKTPWQPDYVDRNNPGSVPVNMNITIFDQSNV